MKKITILILTFVLTACGGSGGENEKPKNNQSDNYIEIKKITTTESGTEFIELNDTRNVEASGIPNGMSIEFLENSVKINMPSNIDRSMISNVTFKNSLTSEVMFIVEIFIENTSARDLLDKINRALSQESSLLNLEDDRKIHYYLVDLLYLKGFYENKEKTIKINSFSPRMQITYTNLESSFRNIKNRLNEYNNGVIGDAALLAEVLSFDQNIIDHGNYGSNTVRELQNVIENNKGIIGDFFPNLSTGEIKYNYNDKIYSRFIGNEYYGLRDQLGWDYKADYGFLNKIINKEISGTCSI
jgi:hypothetical protein